MPTTPTPEEILKKLETPEECDQFEINIRQKYPVVANAARRKAIELRAKQYGASTEMERDALRVIYAYEAALSERNGRKTVARRTWQMVKRHGIRGAVERAVNREVDTLGFKILCDLGLKDLTFEDDLAHK